MTPTAAETFLVDFIRGTLVFGPYALVILPVYERIRRRGYRKTLARRVPIDPGSPAKYPLTRVEFEIDGTKYTGRPAHDDDLLDRSLARKPGYPQPTQVMKDAMKGGPLKSSIVTVWYDPRDPNRFQSTDPDNLDLAIFWLVFYSAIMLGRYWSTGFLVG